MSLDYFLLFFSGPLTRPSQGLYNLELLGYVAFESAEVLRDGQGKVLGAIGVSGTGAGKGEKTRNLDTWLMKDTWLMEAFWPPWVNASAELQSSTWPETDVLSIYI